MVTDIHCHLETVAAENMASFIAAGDKIGAVSVKLVFLSFILIIKRQ